jgi:hypothetical protein
MSHAKFKHPNCLNCHYPLAEFDKFCPNCGQKPVAPKAAMHDLIHEFIHSNFHLDGKFFSTLKHLFIPGKLTEEFFKGHHKRYAHPIQLYLVLGGLFLLIMSTISNKAEAKFQKEIDKKQTTRTIRRVLAKMDSTAQQMTAYKEDPSVKKAIDSLLVKQFTANNKSEETADIRKNYVENKESSFKEQLKIKCLRASVSPDAPKDENKIAYIEKKYQTKYTLLQADSATLVHNYAELERLSIKEALSSLETNFSLQSVGRKMTGKDDYDGKWLKDAEKDAEKAVKNDLNQDGSFMGGYKNSKKEAKSDSFHENVQQYKDLKMRLKVPDSATIVFFSTPVKVAQNDLMDMESNEIIEKYKITGFWRTRFAKRTILFRQEGSAMMHTFIGKFLWIISLSLLPTAGFMYLLYWRQRRYFSEHVVWLLHLNCLTFILFPLLGLGVIYQANDIADWLAAPFLIAATIAPFIALKRYYKQSWGKTILKGFIFQIAYSIIGTIAFLIGGIVSFLFL